MKHSISLHEMSIVVVGQNHNPSILNQDFLWRNGIVSDEIKLAGDQPTFSTPAVSKCVFENGLHIGGDSNRVHFTRKNSGENDAICYDVAKRYLRVVPLVHYTAVGINFNGHLPVPHGELVPHNMLKPGKWDQFEGVRPSAEIVLTYSLVGRSASLAIKADTNTDSENNQNVVILGNFHHDIQAEEGDSYRIAVAIVDEWKNDLKCFKHLADNIAEYTKSMGEQ